MKFKNTKARTRRITKAKEWIPTYNGKNLVKGYRKHFNVSKICAVGDLTLLGYEFSEEYINKLIIDEENKRKEKEKRRLKNKHETYDLVESNEYFAYIAGYTENGFPYGITWEQAEELGIMEDLNINNENDDALPF